MTHLHVMTSPVRIENEAGEVLVEYGEAPDLSVVCKFLHDNGNIFHCNDPLWFKPLADMHDRLFGVNGNYIAPGADLTHLPDDYVFPFGGNVNKKKSDVPYRYVEWWEQNIARNRWFKKAS